MRPRPVSEEKEIERLDQGRTYMVVNEYSATKSIKLTYLQTEKRNTCLLAKPEIKFEVTSSRIFLLKTNTIF